MYAPTRRTRLLFWLLLSMLSVFFAEIISGSYIFPYTTPAGLVIVLPVYALHTLVLAHIVFRSGRARFSTLFLAGVLFGLYEAYITKVLWSPTWGDPIISMGGIAVFELMVLVLWWHPFMAFIIPTIVASSLLSSGRERLQGLPEWLHRRIASKGSLRYGVYFAVWAGLLQGGAVPPAASLVSGLVALAILLLLIHLFRSRTSGTEHRLAALLPRRGEAFVILALLLALYVVMGIGMRPEALPGLAPQAVIWAVYAVVFYLLLRGLKKQAIISAARSAKRFRLQLRTALVLGFVFVATSFLVGLLGQVPIVLVISWFPGAALGVYFLYYSIRDVMTGRDVGAPLMF